MPANLKRVTFTLTPELETALGEVKKELFDGCSRSDMIRELVLAGLRSFEEKKSGKKTRDRVS